jgi:flagellar motor switch protein FliG
VQVPGPNAFGKKPAAAINGMAAMTPTLSAPPMLGPPQTGQENSASAGPRQAAILLTSVGDVCCAELLRRMEEDEVHQLTREISRLSGVSPEERTAVSQRFMKAVEAPQFSAGGIDYATSVLVTAFGPETGRQIAARVLKSLGNEATNIDSLQKTDPQHLAQVVQREHPQTIALVLSRVGPSHAAKILSALPDSVRVDVVRRMAMLDQISPEVVNKIAKTLTARLRSLGESSLESYGGVRAVAEVLNRVDSSTGSEILRQINEGDPTLGQSIQNLMFVFMDLLHVDDATLRAITGKVDRKVLVVALKGCSVQVKNRFMSLMSTRAGEMLNEDMAALGPVRIRDVEEAQHAIIAIARQLEVEGVISLKPISENDFVV